MTRPSALRALALRSGILASYVDTGHVERATSDDTRVALLHAMGIDASDEQAAERALERLDTEQHGQLLDPVTVIAGNASGTLRVHLPDAVRADYTLELTLEDRTAHALHGAVQGPDATLALPHPLPLGYHRLRLAVNAGGRTHEATQTVIVAPAQCAGLDRLARTRAAGVIANLYSVQSNANWGCGDLGDLRRLAGWARAAGAAFVGVNPLHALRNRGTDISPYSPVSRLYHNPIYLDVPALPELADAPEAAALLASPAFAAARDALRAGALVDYEGVMNLKRRVLEPMHRAFARLHRDRDTPRGEAYARYRQRHGKSLDQFAIFCALDAHMSLAGPHGSIPDWHAWPAPLRDPNSGAVAEFTRANAEAVDFHRYLQFALDAQLAAAGDGLALGIYRDLAVGSAVNGSDTWAWPALFARDATVGAPPDAFAVDGQDWGFPPVVPQALRADHYHYWTRLLRAGFAHAGALRLDHVLGLFRLFWVPAGASAAHGAYVQYPADDLLAIVALESHRHGAVVVGENLGTVPPEVGPALERWGLLASAVTYFERDAEGGFLAPARYPVRALVTAGTHDHVPLAGFWSGRDLEIRRAIGVLADDAALVRARAERANDRQALVARLIAEQLLPAGQAPDAVAIVRGVHALLARTPTRMVGAALDDLALETDPVNIPGTTEARYPNWRRKMHRALEDITDPDGTAALTALAAAVASDAY